MLFWSSLWISWALLMNKFLFGEIRAFMGKMIIIGFGRCHGNLGGKNKVEQDKIRTICDSRYLCISMDWVAF